MTGEQVLKRACAYLMEDAHEDSAFSEAALPLINTLIAESLKCQNSRNAAAGIERVESAEIKSLSDEIPLDDIICTTALPVGLASCFYSDELDLNNAREFRERFLTALSAAERYAMYDITDGYGGK